MKQITEDYCNKDISVMLKEKGFDVPVKNYFSLNKDAMLHNLDKKYGAKKNWNAFEICISRPSQSLALKWLREVHKLHIYAKPYWPQGDMRNKMSWQGFIVDLNTINGDSQCYADSYEEAIENRIRFTLENLI